MCHSQGEDLTAYMVQVYMLLGSVAGKNILNDQKGLSGQETGHLSHMQSPEREVA